MRPTLEDGEVILVRRRGAGRHVAAGRIVVAVQPGFPPILVKRVLAIEAEEAVLPPVRPGEPGMALQYLLIADNLGLPAERRRTVQVPEDDIRGEVILVAWPPRRWRRLR